jgi:Putative esterase
MRRLSQFVGRGVRASLAVSARITRVSLQAFSCRGGACPSFVRAVLAVSCVVALFAACGLLAAPAPHSPHQNSSANSPARFAISFDSKLSATPLDGRVYVVISTTKDPEPREQILEVEVRSQQVFGADIDGLAPGQPAFINDDALGYPTASFRDIPRGDYWVQGVLNKYTTFHRADGHTVKLPMDEGEGQHWNSKPGNFYSEPVRIYLNPAETASAPIQIHLDKIIPPIAPPKDTEWVKHFKIQSQVLTKFWGRPMYLGAIVVLPEGWTAHPNAHYPLLLDHGHFPDDFHGFRASPPDPGASGFQLERQQTAYQFYQDWTAGKLPRMLLLLVQHANPYYDDSYAVDSANVGPYGEAINHELIPAVEKQFRGIGQGWARAIYGGSTGGWETLATQIFYPDEFNGAWGACPDPIDFHAYQMVNIYDDQNAFWTIGPFGRIAQGEMRTPPGQILATTEGTNRWELVLGTRGRSGEQWDIWQAVFSPVDANGYPAEIWDQRTGVINHEVAAYWREHYDLTAILQRNWSTLGPKLQGKLHVMVGTADTFYLDSAVHLMQKFLETTSNPHSDATFDYGVDQPHCYTGPPGSTTREGGLTFTQRTLKAATSHMLESAPPGADTTSWRY